LSLLRNLFLVLAAVSLPGCVSFTPSNEGGSFVLTENYLWPESGLGGAAPRMAGLTPGEYIAVGHNGDGIYYRGPYGGVLMLEDPLGEHYLKTGERPIDVSQRTVTNGLNGEGGVFIPYDPADTPYLFYYQDFRRLTGDKEARMPARPASQINTFKEAPPVGDVLPFRPAAVTVNGIIVSPANPQGLYVNVIDPLNPQGLPTPAGIVGAAVAPHVGRAIALPALRGMQGNLEPISRVKNERLIKILREVMREKRYVKSSANPGETSVAKK